MLMFASYSYLGLLGHPKINAAAKAAIDEYGTGTHGVRMLAGTLKLHGELEETIARFKRTEDAVTFSSGYVTNLTAISTMVGRHDVVICDKLNHASIVDGCLLSGADMVRFRHNDMVDLERCLQKAEPAAPPSWSWWTRSSAWMAISPICRGRRAMPQVWRLADGRRGPFDGVLGKTGRGIEEHFGLDRRHRPEDGHAQQDHPVGRRLPGRRQDLIDMFRHASRAFIFSAAMPPAQAAAAKAAFEVIVDEPERVDTLRRNAAQFTQGLRQLGFDTMRTETAIVPVLCGPDDRAFTMVSYCQRENIFVLPVVSPAVPEGLARLRATVTAAHTVDDIDTALAVFEKAGKRTGII